jgi:GTP:adenosylcobinamide-phosphate guanylyltransferase
MDTPQLSTIVLAGGTAKPEFTAATGVNNRALVELAPGKTMLSFVLGALHGASSVGDIIIVGDMSPQPNTTLVAPGETLIDNIQRGITASGAANADMLLLVSSDIPFIKPSEVDSYIADSIATGADFCYPIIPMADYRRRFAQMKRTTLKLREGEFTGGNIMLVRAGVILQNPDSIHKAYAARKSPLALGKMLGWGLLTRILVSQIAAPNLLAIPLLENAIGRLLGGVTARAVITTSASIGTDIDQVEDVEIARKILADSCPNQDM